MDDGSFLQVTLLWGSLSLLCLHILVFAPHFARITANMVLLGAFMGQFGHNMGLLGVICGLFLRFGGAFRDS